MTGPERRTPNFKILCVIDKQNIKNSRFFCIYLLENFFHGIRSGEDQKRTIYATKCSNQQMVFLNVTQDTVLTDHHFFSAPMVIASNVKKAPKHTKDIFAMNTPQTNASFYIKNVLFQGILAVVYILRNAVTYISLKHQPLLIWLNIVHFLPNNIILRKLQHYL